MTKQTCGKGIGANMRGGEIFRSGLLAGLSGDVSRSAAACVGAGGGVGGTRCCCCC